MIDKARLYKHLAIKHEAKKKAFEAAIILDNKRREKERVLREVDYILYGTPDQITDKRPRSVRNGFSVGGFGK